jgi:hypothetical protein
MGVTGLTPGDPAQGTEGKDMNKTASRTRLRIAALGGLVAVSSVLPAVVGATGLKAASAATPADEIQYVQAGAAGVSEVWVPGSGTGGFSQTVTPKLVGNGCFAPTISGSPILALSANNYPSGYSGAPTPSVVGMYKGIRTGVCAQKPPWSIQVNEGLDFGLGSNAVDTGRLITEAQITLTNEEAVRLPNQPPFQHPVTGNLVLLKAGAVVATQSFGIPAQLNSTIVADTGMVAGGFTQVEVQVDSASNASVSVTGTSTFILNTGICIGQTIQTASTDGTVSVAVTYVSNNVNPVCKTVTQFAATTTSVASSNGKEIDFFAGATAGAQTTAHFDWGDFPFCQANNTGPPCPPTLVDFNDGTGAHPETPCAIANPPSTPPWCVTGRSVSFVPDPNNPGALLSHITEDWSGFGDPGWRF